MKKGPTDKPTQKRKGIDVRKKGHRFERRLAKKFTTWDGSGRTFSSTRGSGAWDKAPGDLLRDERFPFLIEAKDHSIESGPDENGLTKKWWSIMELFSPKCKKPRMAGWWQEARLEAEAADKIPWLIFTSNYFPDFLVMEQSVFNWILEHVPELDDVMYAKFTSSVLRGPTPTVMILLDPFLDRVSEQLLDDLFVED